MESFFREQFARLQIDSDRMGGLNEIQGKLQTLQPEEISHHVKLSDLSNVLSLCGADKTTSSEQTTVACDVLSMCLSSLDLNKNEENVLLLDDMIRHGNDSVKEIGLTQLERHLKKNPGQKQSSSVILDVVKCLDSPSTPVGSLATRILIEQLPLFFDSEDVLSAVEAAGSSSSVAKCRVYDLITTVACQSPKNIARLQSVLDRIVADLSSDDVLLQLNVMEILSTLVVTDCGLEYLEQQGIFSRLLTALENIDMMYILFPGYIKFFGSVANSHPDKIFIKFSHICKPLFETIIANDSSTLSACLETLGVLGRTKEGKIGLSTLNLVFPDGGDMKMVLMEMAMFLTTLPTEEQIRILNCLELLFKWEPETEPDNRICSITESWYSFVDRGPGLKLLLGYIRNPFPDIKSAGLEVLRSVLNYPWGRKALSDTAGMLEYILDRKADCSTEAHQTKYEILLTLSRRNEDFSDAQKKEIKDYVAKGAFYKKGVTEVAMEN